MLVSCVGEMTVNYDKNRKPFISDSVYSDEPTCGMDIAARKATWELLLNHRQVKFYLF